MIVEHKIVNGITQHKCYNCGNLFTFGKDSFVFGKMEYKTIQEKQKTEKYFCKKICIDNFINNLKKQNETRKKHRIL